MERNSPNGERGLELYYLMMHKAKKKEEAKQRQLRAILNKLTPQNFYRLFEQVKAVNIDNAVTLVGVVLQIYEKALMEPIFCEMYANFCSHLAFELPDFSVDNEKISFKKTLLNKCQEEFERGEREQEEANKVDEAEGEVKLSNEETEQRRTKVRRRMLGNIRLIGELYKKKMLTERIMHECIKKLLGQCQDPDEEDVEALCKLMSIIGEMIDHPKTKEHMDVYFERLKILSNNMNLSSRLRFMLKDVIDLRRNRWQVRRKVDGPKKIEEVHRDVVQERQAQAQAGSMGCGMGNNQSARMNLMDFGPSGINGYGSLSERTPYGSREDLASRYMSDRPSSPAGYGHLSAPAHNINYGSKDLRNDDRNLNRPFATSPYTQSQGPIVSQNASSDERLRDMCLSAIREYYSFQQRGLIPPPQNPLKMMHKAEKKYGEEEAKQRQLRAILNKLTPQNFDRLFEQVKAVNIDNAITLTGVISQIYEKALMEPIFCEMYANFCFHLAYQLPDLSVDNEKITFKRLFLNKCQKEFERGEREQEKATKVDEAEGEVKLSNEEREQKRTKARRRMLGNIRLIGELYKIKMLTERIMHECIKKLLGQCHDPDEEDVEALCKLMSIIGEMIDHPKAKEHMDLYFERLKILSNNMNLPSRVRFMLKDVIDLRRNRWQVRRKVDGPKKIKEVHRDVVQERQAQAQAGRMGRGMGNNQSTSWNPIDFGPSGINGYGSLSERTPYGSREDLASRYMSDRPSSPAGYGHLSAPAHNINNGSRDLRNGDRNLNRPIATSPHAQLQWPIVSQNASLDERLRDMCLSPIREYYKVRFMLKDIIDLRRNRWQVRRKVDGSKKTEKVHRDVVQERPAQAQAGRMGHGMGNDQSVRKNPMLRNDDRNLNSPVATSPHAQLQGPIVSQNSLDERLRDMSLSATREYYRTRRRRKCRCGELMI